MVHVCKRPAAVPLLQTFIVRRESGLGDMVFHFGVSAVRVGLAVQGARPSRARDAVSFLFDTVMYIHLRASFFRSLR